jgi:hypothetical protein
MPYNFWRPKITRRREQIDSSPTDKPDTHMPIEAKPQNPLLYLFSRSLSSALTVLGGVAFGGSTFINSVIFSQWGLSFTQIATPADVIMSGLSAFTTIIALLLAFILPTTFLEIVRKRAGYRSMLIISIYFTLAGGLGLLLPTFYALAATRYLLPMPVTLRNVIDPPFVVFFYGFYLAGGYYDLYSSEYRGLSSAMNKSLYRWVSILLFFTIGVLMLSWSVGSIVSKYTNSGYQVQPIWLIDAPAGCEGRVLWLGERNIVLSCGRKPGDAKIVVSAQTKPGSFLSGTMPKTLTTGAKPWPVTPATPTAPIATAEPSTRVPMRAAPVRPAESRLGRRLP